MIVNSFTEESTAMFFGSTNLYKGKEKFWANMLIRTMEPTSITILAEDFSILSFTT